jgi:hypothetical protein
MIEAIWKELEELFFSDDNLRQSMIFADYIRKQQELHKYKADYQKSLTELAREPSYKKDLKVQLLQLASLAKLEKMLANLPSLLTPIQLSKRLAIVIVANEVAIDSKAKEILEQVSSAIAETAAKLADYKKDLLNSLDEQRQQARQKQVGYMLGEYSIAYQAMQSYGNESQKKQAEEQLPLDLTEFSHIPTHYYINGNYDGLLVYPKSLQKKLPMPQGLKSPEIFYADQNRRWIFINSHSATIIDNLDRISQINNRLVACQAIDITVDPQEFIRQLAQASKLHKTIIQANISISQQLQQVEDKQKEVRNKIFLVSWKTDILQPIQKNFVKQQIELATLLAKKLLAEFTRACSGPILTHENPNISPLKKLISEIHANIEKNSCIIQADDNLKFNYDVLAKQQVELEVYTVKLAKLLEDTKLAEASNDKIEKKGVITTLKMWLRPKTSKTKRVNKVSQMDNQHGLLPKNEAAVNKVHDASKATPSISL